METGISMIDTLRDFVQKMNVLGIEYMVTGSYAMGVYADIRMTRDIDVVVELRDSRTGEFFNLFKDEYYISEAAMRRAVSRKSMFNVISRTHGGKIDCIIKKDSEWAQTSFRRRRREALAGFEFWTSTKEDLIVAKLLWAKDSHSEMQIRDIANLTGSEYDSDYVQGWINRLALNEIWAEVIAWKTQHNGQDD